MSRWETLLHPSWDRIHLSGMTEQEIADFIGRARSTMHRYLQVREKYNEDFCTVHEAARAAQRRCTHDGFLDDWLRIQRRQHRAGALHPAKLQAVNQVWPGWAVTQEALNLGSRPEQ